MIGATRGIQAQDHAAKTRADRASTKREAKRVASINEKKPASLKPAKEERLSIKVLALFTRQMSMLLRSGSGLVPAIQSIAKQMSKPAQKDLLNNVAEDLEEGVSLTESFKKHPRTFDSVFCAIVAAGEAGAMLPQMFERLAAIVGKQRAMRNKIGGAMAYPILLIFMCIHIILGLMLFVMPRFADMFVQLDVEIPASTQFMLSSGKFISEHWAILLGCILACGAGIAWVVISKKGRQWLADFQLSIPIVGKLRSKLIQGSVFRTLGLLLQSKVGLLDSIALIRGATSNSAFQKMFKDLEDSVTSGGSISYALEASGIVEPYLCQAVRTGEECGNIDGALLFAADMLDESNTEAVDVVARLIEPIILLGMGVVVGAVCLSLFIPMFDMTSAM